MKRILSLALLALATGAMAQKANELRVRFTNPKVGNTLVAEYTSRDTIVSKKAGKFDFTIQLNSPVDLTLYALDNGQKTGGWSLVAVPGNTVDVKLDESITEGWVTISGKGFYKGYREVDELQFNARKPISDLIQEYQDRVAKGEDQNKLGQEVMERYSQCSADAVNTFMNYIRSHSNSELSTVLIPALGSIDNMTKGIELLSPEVREGRMKSYYMAPIQAAKAEAEARAKAQEEAKRKQAQGVEATDFTLDDINGSPLTLSSLRGKYVLLDFWGSWCGWCIKGMPKMKEYYSKYAGKFEILGIDCNDTEEKWKEAVEKHELPWLHVYCTREKMSDLLGAYGIQGFPTKILINPEGRIDKTVVGEDPAFYDYMDQKFGNDN